MMLLATCVRKKTKKVGECRIYVEFAIRNVELELLDLTSL